MEAFNSAITPSPIPVLNVQTPAGLNPVANPNSGKTPVVEPAVATAAAEPVVAKIATVAAASTTYLASGRSADAGNSTGTPTADDLSALLNLSRSLGYPLVDTLGAYFPSNPTPDATSTPATTTAPAPAVVSNDPTLQALLAQQPLVAAHTVQGNATPSTGSLRHDQPTASLQQPHADLTSSNTANSQADSDPQSSDSATPVQSQTEPVRQADPIAQATLSTVSQGQLTSLQLAALGAGPVPSDLSAYFQGYRSGEKIGAIRPIRSVNLSA